MLKRRAKKSSAKRRTKRPTNSPKPHRMKKLLEVKAWFAAIDRAGGANFPDVRPAPIRGEEPSAKNLRDRR